jgi:hypothetical protein
MAYEFKAEADGSVSVRAEPSPWKDDLYHSKEIRRICANTDLLTVYFDTGQTFAQGHFYETRFRDARFEDWHWAKLGGFAVDTEKPLEGKKLKIDGIGKRGDTSLFGFVAKHWPDLQDGRTGAGWLICDDGSMESADFIHFDDQVHPPRLSLIHVKGSGSAAANRPVSVTDYEIVVGQAIKNLRYLDRTNLADKLALEEENMIGTAVWHNGVRQKGRKDVIRVLQRAGSNLEKAVYVLQPRVRKSAGEALSAQMQAGGSGRDVRRLQQLNTLLLAARAECYGLGTEFHVIGEDDVGRTRPQRRRR